MPYLYLCADRTAYICYIENDEIQEDEHYVFIPEATVEVVAEELKFHYSWLMDYDATMWAKTIVYQ